MELAPFIVNIPMDSKINPGKIVAEHIAWINKRIEFLFDLEKSNRSEYGAGILVGIEDKDFPGQNYYDLNWITTDTLSDSFSNEKQVEQIKCRMGDNRVVVAFIALSAGNNYNLIYQLDLNRINNHIMLNQLKHEMTQGQG